MQQTGAAKAFEFKMVLEIAQLPGNLKNAIIDEAYKDDATEAMQLEAAIRLMDVPAAKRNTVYSVSVSTFEKLEVEAVGKFVFVHAF